VEEELADHFGPLIDFVRKAEAVQRSSSSADTRPPASGSGREDAPRGDGIGGAGRASASDGAAPGFGGVDGAGGDGDGGGNSGGSSRGGGGAGGLYTPEAASVLMRDFAERWKGAIEQMHRDVITHFSNLQRGMDILQRTLSQLFIYYTRFTGPEGVLARMGPDGAALCKGAVTNPAFIYEIKRHSQSRVV